MTITSSNQNSLTSIRRLKNWWKILIQSASPIQWIMTFHISITLVKDTNYSHTFTHGTTGNVGYPIAHYFNIVQMLGLNLEHAYMILCEETQIDTKINGVDIISRLEENMKLMWEQSEKRSQENFKIITKHFIH